LLVVIAGYQGRDEDLDLAFAVRMIPFEDCIEIQHVIYESLIVQNSLLNTRAHLVDHLQVDVSLHNVINEFQEPLHKIDSWRELELSALSISLLDS
jgi:hypothetical protein